MTVTGGGVALSREHRPRSRVRSLALPSEHGGWSLTIEPVLLGLLVAWSWPGLAMGVAAVVAFMARTPAKIVLVDRWRCRWLERTRIAATIAAVELTALAAAAAVVAVSAPARAWVPVVLAAPLVVVELWFDMRSRSRRVIPELCGPSASALWGRPSRSPTASTLVWPSGCG